MSPRKVDGAPHASARTRGLGEAARAASPPHTPSPVMTLASLCAKLRELVPSSPPASGAHPPPDRARCFVLLAEISVAIRACDASLVKASQREMEDLLLRICVGGWAGPAVRKSASDVLCALFAVGNSVALYARVNELLAVVTSPIEKGAVAASASQHVGARVGALECVETLARGGARAPPQSIPWRRAFLHVIESDRACSPIARLPSASSVLRRARRVARRQRRRVRRRRRQAAEIIPAAV